MPKVTAMPVASSSNRSSARAKERVATGKMLASLIVAAGGLGKRFESSVKDPGPRQKLSKTASLSKLFFPLQNKPVLNYCIESFQSLPQITETVIAVPKGSESAVKMLAR